MNRELQIFGGESHIIALVIGGKIFNFPQQLSNQKIDAACRLNYYLEFESILCNVLYPSPLLLASIDAVYHVCKQRKSVRLKLAWWPPKTVVLKLDLVSPDGDKQTK